MSSIETNIGRLRRLDFLSKNEKNFTDIDIEEWIKKKCLENDIKKESFHKNWLDAWNDCHYKEKGYILEYKGKYYEIISNKDIEDNDICEISDNGDGTYNYIMRFYNGGTCLPEMLEYGLEELKYRNYKIII